MIVIVAIWLVLKINLYKPTISLLPKELQNGEVVVQTKWPSEPSSVPKKLTNKQAAPNIMQTQVANSSQSYFILAIFLL